jgi:hypothetical protein
MSKGILAKDLRFIWALFSGDSGGFRVRGGEGALSTIWNSGDTLVIPLGARATPLKDLKFISMR